MRHLLLLVMTTLLLSVAVQAQINVGSNQAPDSSAMLQISGNTKGFLPPRMTRDTMLLIHNPAKGLLVFNTTDSLLYMRRDTGWVALAAGEQLWQKNGDAIYNNNTGFVGIGTNNPSTLLHVEGANPLTLLGVADGTTTVTDSVLTITDGLVRKVPLASLAMLSNGISLANAPLIYSGGVISINQSSTTDDGYLSASDYNIFNNKVSSISLTAGTLYPTTSFGITGGAATATLSLNTQAKNRVFAGPISGANAQPTFRALVSADLPPATTSALGAVSVGSGLSVTVGGVLSATNTSSGSVTSISVSSANGLTGTVANATTTPAITLSTTVTGMVKGNGTALSAATPGTDYAPGTAANATGIVKSTTGTGALTTATASDFPTLNQNTTGTAANITGVLNATSLPALTGDVTTTAGSVNTTIANSAVTNAKMANMAANTFKANNTGSSAAPSDITATQATAMLNTFTSSLKGLVPASSGGTANFLRADGTFAVPSGTNAGTVTSVSVTSSNGVSGSVATNTTTPAISLTLGDITPASVAATGTVTGSNLSGTNTGDETNATIKTKLGTASATTDGYLTQADWNTFNSKATSTNTWSITGNAGTNYATNFLGTTDNKSLRFRTNNLQRMILDSLGNAAIGTSIFDATNPEKFLIDAGSTNSVNGLVAKGSINNYFQFNVKNSSSGGNATSDIVATADNGTESTNYVDLGINGSGYTGSAIQTGVANDGYLISSGNDFYMVNSSANKNMLFLTGGTGVANERMRILANGRVGMGVQDPTAQFVVKDTMEIRRTGTLSQLLFTNTAGTGDLRIGGDGGDLYWQGGGSRNLQMGSYWTTVLGGDRQGNGGAYPAFANGTGGTGVLVQAQRDASVPLGVQANSGSQSANLTEWRNASGTVLSAVTKDGNLGIGISNPSTKLHIVGTNPLTLNGVQTGANTDSILTIINGTVKKLSPSALAVSSSNAWGLTGNTNTLSNNYFLGTTNSDPLIFKVNSQIAGRLDASNTFLGSLAGNSNGTTANQNTGVGIQALSANTSGTNNTAIGYNSLQGNVSGSNNIGVGYAATVASNSSYSIAIGASSYVNNASSIAVGNAAQTNNTSGLAIGNYTYVNGTNGIAIGNGTSSARTQGYGNYSVALGNYAYAGGANSIAIGNTINSNASNSIAIGASSQATVANSTALGASASAAGNNSTAIGYNAAVASDNTMILGDKSNAALSVGIGSEAFSNGNREKLLVDAGTSSSVNVISGKGNLNNYLQLNIQNKNAGASASSDLVATADNGDETNNYVDLGINSSGNTANLFGGANDAYLYTQTQNLLIGTASASKSISFLTAGGNQSTNERMRIDGSGNVGIGTASPSTKLHIVGTNPLTLNGVQTGTSSSSDSLLTITSGLVKKIPISTFTSGNSWSVTGNTSTNPSANFLGTTDAQPLLIKINNQQIGRLEQTSFAFGAGAGTNTATNSLALGYGAVLGSGVSNAMSIGNAANAGITNTFAIGNSAVSNPNNGGNSFAIGNSATVASTGSFVIGSSASTAASISDAFAIGSSAIVNGSSSMAIGKSASTGTGATSAVAIGNGVQANATGSVSIGSAATAVGTGSTNSIAIGTGASIGASLTNSTAIGANASTTFSNTMILGDRSNQLLSVGIGSEAFSPTTREKLLVDAGTVTTDGYISVIGAKGSTNNYMQVNLQNKSNGSIASTDVVATNDAGTELNQTGFVDMGINSTGNTSTGVLGGNSTAYLYSTGNDFSIGNNTSTKSLNFFTTDAGGSAERMRINGTGNVGIGTTSPSTALHVVGTNPLTLTGVQTGSNTSADSLLTITNGLVRKLPLSTFASPTNSWSTTGNAGTNSVTNFLGTVDNNALNFKTNNISRMRLDSAGGLFIGDSASSYTNTVNNTQAGMRSDWTTSLTSGDVPRIALQGQMRANLTSSSSSAQIRGFNGSALVGVNSGVTSNADVYGGYFLARRQTATGITEGTGTLNILAGAGVEYGNTSTASSGGTINNVYGIKLIPSFASGTITNMYGLYAGAPTTGGNVTNLYDIYLAAQSLTGVTNSWGIYQANTKNNYFGGKVGIGNTSPTAILQLAAGTTAANTAPLKLTSGTNLSTPEAGAVEYDGTNYFATSGTTRYTLAKTLTNTAVLDFPNTSANSVSTLTITVTGARDGDAVVLGVPGTAGSAPGAYTAYVSANDTVTVKFSNGTGSGNDPLGGTFRVSILKY